MTRILLIEDNPLVLTTTSSLLEALGHEVVAVDNGPDAIAQIDSAGRFDLMIADNALPDGFDAKQLAAHLQQRQPDTPILLVSGSQLALSEFAALGLTRIDFLQKPFGLSALRLALAKQLGPNPVPG